MSCNVVNICVNDRILNVNGSLGVLFYVMLSGETPFPDEDDADNLWNLIKEGKWSFKDCSTNVWDTISIDCKDLISNRFPTTSMLVLDDLVCSI